MPEKPTIRYLRDRDSEAKVRKKYPTAADILQRNDAFLTGSKEKLVAWVGLAQATKEGALVVLPHGAPEEDPFAIDLMRAIVRFAREFPRAGDAMIEEGATQAALLANLATDFRDFGIYSTRERLRSRHDGKPDWARTIKSEAAFPADNGSPVYTNISTARYSSLETNLISRIQAQVLCEIKEAHDWWLEDYFGNRTLPSRPHPIEWPRKIWPNLLRLARRDLFQSRVVRLVDMLIAYLEDSDETGAGGVVCGISDFHTVWETMLRETLDGVERWNRFLPRPYYVNEDGKKAEAGRMMMDVVVRNGESILIIDAKYYRATSEFDIPKTYDITKQIMYQYAMESTGKITSGNLTNVFAFPAEETGRKPYESVKFFLRSEGLANSLPQIKCQYISVKDVVTAYAARQKMVDQSWLTELCKPQ